MKDYDLILVVGYFRSAASFLSVILKLGQTLRIAVLPVETDPSLRAKTGDAHAVYLDLCREFGADLLSLGERARATLLAVQQFVYDDALAQAIQRNLTVSARVGLMTLAMAGIPKHDAYLAQFGIRKVYVPSRRFMKFLLDKRGAQVHYKGIEIEEVGLPFKRHRPFPQFTADWVIAAPTLFSFHSEAGKQQFLLTVNQLLNQIPSDDVVVYKPHNGNGLDYFAPRIHHQLAGWLAKVPRAERLLRYVQLLPWSWLRLQIERVQSCMLHRAILNRAIPMFRLTPYADISLEAFLPGVRKGVLGGLSNTIWGTLYFNLPYYNCVDDSLRPGKSELLDKQSDSLLDLNLQYFGVPFCRGDLSIDSRDQGIVQPHERTGDLVAAMMGDLARVQTAHSDVA